jgi:hypothetical protein
MGQNDFLYLIALFYFFDKFIIKKSRKKEIWKKRKNISGILETRFYHQFTFTSRRKNQEKNTKISHGILSDPIFSDFIVTICVFLSLSLSPLQITTKKKKLFFKRGKTSLKASAGMCLSPSSPPREETVAHSYPIYIYAREILQ